jgi:hypothetical protein
VPRCTSRVVSESRCCDTQLFQQACRDPEVPALAKIKTTPGGKTLRIDLADLFDQSGSRGIYAVKSVMQLLLLY